MPGRVSAGQGGPPGSQSAGRARLERLDPPRSAELLDFLARVENLDWTPSVADYTGAPASTAGGSTAPAGPPRMIPVFRVVGDGEVREVGMFEGVECLEAP